MQKNFKMNILLKSCWKIKTLLPISLILSFMSCDPGQSLKIENKTSSLANIKFIFRKGEKPYKLKEFANSDTLVVSLDTSKRNTVKEYHFGIGTWEIQNRLDSLISIVELIEVETWKSKEIYKGNIQIREFFKSRLSGRLHETVVINLE